MSLQAGDKAPDFKANKQDEKEVKLSDFSGKKLVLYFYPKDDTPGCTAEACDLRDNYERLLAQGYSILGVSPDNEKKHRKFIDKYSLPFDLLADTDHKIAEDYGVWVEKSMYGRKYMGVERTTFLIGPDGRILRIWNKVKVPGHAEEVLEAPTPAVVTAQKGLNEPRYASLKGIMAAKKKPLEEKDAQLGEGRIRLEKLSMPAERKEASHTFEQPEEAFRVKCDVHPWMTAYVVTNPNPFFATTGEDGSFSLTSLPAGTYTIEAKVSGGGISSQAEAVRMGVARARLIARPCARRPRGCEGPEVPHHTEGGIGCSVHKAVIPAAGLGTRFLPATKSQPKEMLPVVDKPKPRMPPACGCERVSHDPRGSVTASDGKPHQSERLSTASPSMSSR